MSCNNCQKIISQLKEDPREEKEIIKDLVNCKECSEKIIARCHTCHWPIYKTDLIYESSLDGSLGDGFWIWLAFSVLRISNPEKKIQCEWCRQQWRKEMKKVKEWWTGKKWAINICGILLVIFLLTLFFFFILGVNLGTKLNTLILILSLIPLLVISCSLISSTPNAYKYKFRKRKPEEKLKTTKKKPKT